MMKKRKLLSILAITSAVCHVTTVKGSGEFVPYQFANYGVEFGHKDIPVEEERNVLSVRASLPTSHAPQNVLHVDHPTYTLEKVFKKVGGQDGRERIDATSTWPYSVFGQLQSKSEDGTSQGSGTLVSPHHVLTCAHNVYDATTKRWAREVKFIPALNEHQAPLGVIPVVGAFIHKAYATEGDAADIALLTLAKPVGQIAGWAGLMATKDDRVLKIEKPEITGYPSDKGGTQMWTMFNRFKSIKDTEFTYEIDTYAGQSGSGIWISERGEPYLLGVHTASNQALEENIGTRISTAYFLKLHEQMSRTGALKTALARSIGAPPPIAGVAIPDIARGHEAVYQRFLRGKLIYKPNEDNDNGRKEFRIGDLANPLNGTFDLSGCGSSDQLLSISTGFRTGQNPANKNKLEIWIVPQFVLQKDPRAKVFNDFLQTLEPGGDPFVILFNKGSWIRMASFAVTSFECPLYWSARNLDQLYDGCIAPTMELHHAFYGVHDREVMPVCKWLPNEIRRGRHITDMYFIDLSE